MYVLSIFFQIFIHYLYMIIKYISYNNLSINNKISDHYAGNN